MCPSSLWPKLNSAVGFVQMVYSLAGTRTATKLHGRRLGAHLWRSSYYISPITGNSSSN
jgi:hypothetical protein